MRNTATSRTLHLPESSSTLVPSKQWIWPLPRLDGVHPSIVALRATAADSAQIGYRNRTSSTHLVPVFAVHDGVITYAFRSQRGATLCLDHPGGWCSQYDGLESVLALSTDRFRRRRKVRVQAGDVLGHVRSSLRLGFSLTRLVDGEWVHVDPAQVVHTWTALPWLADRTSDDVAAIAG